MLSALEMKKEIKLCGNVSQKTLCKQHRKNILFDAGKVMNVPGCEFEFTTEAYLIN